MAMKWKQEKLEDTKMTNNDLQNIAHISKYPVIRIPLKTGDELGAPGG